MPFANQCVEAGYSSLRDIPSVEADQCTVGTASLELRDPNTGAPIDLSDYSISSSSSGEVTEVRVVLKEMPEDSVVWAQIKADITDAESGQISFDYDEAVTDLGGIYTGDVQLWYDGHMRRALPFFFIVNHDLANHQGGQLTIAEIRMTLRDVDPEANYLLDALQFSRQEIALCMRRCIDYWNEVPPPVTTYKATNFPWRYHYSRGVAAQLLLMVAQWRLRNDLPYNAGGISIRNEAMWERYQTLGNALWAEWQRWVKDRKYNINVMGGFGYIGGYRREVYYR